MRGFRRVSLGALLAGCLLLSTSATHAAEADRTADDKAIREAAAAYIAALGRGDVPAALAHWTPEGDIVDDAGRKSTARERLERDLAESGESSPAESSNAEAAVSATTIRFLGPDTAMEDGEYGQDGRFSAVWVRRDGQWLLASLREARTVAQPVATLAQLAGLAGTWSGELDGTSYTIEAKWNEAQTYLERKLTATHNGTVLLSAEQRIGVDPEDGQIKSWIHDAEGGHSLGVWSRQGDSWVVESRGVTADGEDLRGTSIYTPEGESLLRWQSQDNWRGGRPMVDFEVTLTRSAETKS